MQFSKRSARRAIPTALAVLALLGSILLAAATPAAAISTSGVWIFPHAKRSAAVAENLDDSFYTGDSENSWMQDSFFADSATDGATASVDLYNPTGAALYNVQVFAAWPVDELDLVESIAFSGGQSGDLSYSGDDLASGGTPTLPGGGSSLDTHDIYPTYFVSYGFGDLGAGSSNIGTFTIEVTGDFASGLLVHLDYTAEDADGNPVSGPFTADMNIFDNGDSEEPPACEPSGLHLVGTLSDGHYTPGTGIDLDATLTIVEDFRYDKSEIRATLSTGSPATVVSASQGTISQGAWSWDITQGQLPINLSANMTVQTGTLHLAGDVHTVSASVSWKDCDGDHEATLSLSSSILNDATGKTRDAGWWADQVGKCEKGKKLALGMGKDILIGMFQAIAAHSDIFTNASWNGTAPDGSDDAGSVDISSCAAAAKVFGKKTDESKKVRGAEREALALWLNIASGALNLDTKLEIYEKKHKCRGSHSEFEDNTGLKSLSSSIDTPGEILVRLEKQIKDWQDGQGDSKAALKLAKRLARSVNNQWLVPA